MIEQGKTVLTQSGNILSRKSRISFKTVSLGKRVSMIFCKSLQKPEEKQMWKLESIVLILQEKLGTTNQGRVYAVYDYKAENDDDVCSQGAL